MTTTSSTATEMELLQQEKDMEEDQSNDDLVAQYKLIILATTIRDQMGKIRGGKTETDEVEVEGNPTSVGRRRYLEKEQKCTHRQVSCESGVDLCMSCGMEVGNSLSFEKDWRFYGSNDSKHRNNPARCHVRKEALYSYSIAKDVEGMSFPETVVITADRIYKQVTKGDILRADSRKSFVLACVFYAYAEHSIPQSVEYLQSKFQLSKRLMSRGIKKVGMKYSKSAPDNSPRQYISPHHIISEMMCKLNASDAHISEVQNLYDRINNRSRLLNRSRPQSVASGLIYYYCRLSDRDMSLHDFSNVVNLSELTIQRVAKEICSIMHTPDII